MQAELSSRDGVKCSLNQATRTHVSLASDLYGTRHDRWTTSDSDDTSDYSIATLHCRLVESWCRHWIQSVV